MNTVSLNLDRGWAYLQLMRPANIITAWADILVGVAISGFAFSAISGLDSIPSASFPNLLCLLLATTGLYGGGVVMNDLCDAAIDATERPERPIPSQRVSTVEATALVCFLLILGIAAAAAVSYLSAAIALAVAVASLSYNAITKHHILWGSLNMGLCRGGNWLLGVSILPTMVTEQAYIACLPLLYIAAITAISQGEVWGGKQKTGAIALVLLAIVLTSMFLLSLLPNFHLLAMLPYALAFALRVLPPFIQATREPSADRIRQAVKVGVLSLILLDASIASGFAGFWYGAIVLLLLPLSLMLAQRFAVT
jgi:4-hydroxybenzoate polyprenyltransferase